MALPRSLPNQITIARLVLAVALFVVLHLVGWAPGHVPAPGAAPGGSVDALADWARSRERLLLNLAAAIFVLAAISDILDGQIARRWNLTTDFGRIADPFADKVVVTGAFLFLVPIAGSGVAAWMVVVIVARESLVDGIRGFAESRGIAFGASIWGKAKMVIQSACIFSILLTLANWNGQPWAERLSGALIAATLLVTVFSGALYVLTARTLLAGGAGGAEPPRAAAGGAGGERLVPGPTGPAAERASR